MPAPAEMCPRCGAALDAESGDGVGQVCRRCNVRFVPAAGQSARAPRPAEEPDEPPGGARLKVALLAGAVLAALLGVTGLVAAICWPRAPARPSAVAAVKPPADPTPADPPDGRPAPDQPPAPAPNTPKPASPKAMSTQNLPPPDKADDPPPPPPDLKPDAPEAKPDDAISRAVARGVTYLKGQIKANFKNDGFAGNRTGLMALAGLALLESGVPSDDAAVQKAAEVVRGGATSNGNTYEISLCVWFLDRLGDPKDENLIVGLAGQLTAGQGASGLWDYACAPGVRGNDLSLTQFAVLALWVARKHKAPVDAAIRRIESRCRAAQATDGGWNYEMTREGGTYESMTCAGLMVLAVGRALSTNPAAGGEVKDPAVSKGLRRLNDLFEQYTPPPLPEVHPKPPQAQRQPADVALEDAKDKLETFLAELDERASGATLWIPPKNLRADRDAVKATQSLGLEDEYKDRLRNAAEILQKYDGTSVTKTKQLLEALGPFRKPPPPVPDVGSPDQAPIDVYTLWSLERMAVVYDFKTVAGHDWYGWGARALVAAQQADGSWAKGYPGVVDTSLALLFLKRANVAKDLTAKMLELGPIKDVKLDRTTTKSPNETPQPKPGPGNP